MVSIEFVNLFKMPLGEFEYYIRFCWISKKTETGS